MGFEERIEKAGQICEAYRQKGFHCSESSIRACSEIMGLKLSDDVLRCASGFRGGGGGWWDRCGVVEAGCMLISYMYGRLTPEQKIWDYSKLIRVLHDRFIEKFGSIECRDLRPMAYDLSGAAQNCSYMYIEGAKIVADVLLNSEEILAQVPLEERNA